MAAEYAGYVLTISSEAVLIGGKPYPTLSVFSY